MKNLTIILTIFGALILGCSDPNKPTNAPATNAAKPVVADKTAKVEPMKDEISKITWKEYDGIFNIRSTTTDMQKEAAWKNYEGKRVQWSGTVTEVGNGSVNGLSVSVKINKETLVSDLIVYLKESETDKASKLSKGSPVTFIGTLSSYGGAVLPTYLTDGELR
jgi:tRNA_anti-like